MERAGDAIFLTTPDAKIVDVNDAACKMLGYSREELLLLHVYDIDPKFPRDSWPAHWQELRAKGTLSFETQQVTRGGLKFSTETTVNYLQFAGREYHCAIMRDIRSVPLAAAHGTIRRTGLAG